MQRKESKLGLESPGQLVHHMQRPGCFFAELHLAKIEWRAMLISQVVGEATVIAMRHHAMIRQFLPSAATAAQP